MLRLSPQEYAELRAWFPASRPGPMVGLHVLHTGQGSITVDRWPEPRAVLAESGGNYSLHGQGGAFSPAELAELIQGFVEAPEAFAPGLQQAFPDLKLWERVVLEAKEALQPPPPEGVEVRRLQAGDAGHLRRLSPVSSWIYVTWGSPETCAGSGMAWGAFEAGRLASVAATFYVGERYEDIGIVTEPGYRRRGLSAACAGALLQDILERGRLGSWSTSPDNLGSLRVAEKIGFRHVRNDRLYAAGVSIPLPE